MKNNLDDLNFIKKLDKSGCLSSIKYFPDQIENAWHEVKSLPVENYANISSVYFCGMGGSAYAGRIIKFLFREKLNVSVDIIDNYTLPRSVNKNSLIFLSSYSGNTKETLSCLNQALSENLNVVGITSGGKLADSLKSKNKPVFVFDDKLNPSRQPRLGQGYMLSGTLGILSKLKFIEISDTNINELVSFLEKESLSLDEKSPSNSNSAKKLADFFSDKVVNLMAGEFLEGVLHAVRNPLNETGKHFANYFVLPESNHHLLEGLRFPNSLAGNSVFVFLKSGFYSQELDRRIEITKDVIGKNKVKTLDISLKGNSALEQSFELIQLLAFVSFYLAVLHNVDPAPVPWVDYFKKSLSADEAEGGLL